MTTWRLDTDQWPGPDRRRWHITRDLVEPSPDGRLACVLYSCFEIRLNIEVGLLTLLAGPPESPTLLVQPRNFTCLDFSPSPSMRWLSGSAFVAVTQYRYDARRNRADLALTFLDPAKATWASVDVSAERAGQPLVEDGDTWILPPRPGGSESGDLRISPRALTWTPWAT